MNAYEFHEWIWKVCWVGLEFCHVLPIWSKGSMEQGGPTFLPRCLGRKTSTFGVQKKLVRNMRQQVRIVWIWEIVVGRLLCLRFPLYFGLLWTKRKQIVTNNYEISWNTSTSEYHWIPHVVHLDRKHFNPISRWYKRQPRRSFRNQKSWSAYDRRWVKLQNLHRDWRKTYRYQVEFWVLSWPKNMHFSLQFCGDIEWYSRQI